MKKILILLLIFSYLSLNSKVFLAMVENNTADGHYKYFGEEDDGIGAFLVTPLSTKTALNFTDITLDTTTLSDIKGCNPNINIKNGQGIASGSCKTENVLPSYLEIWTGQPNEVSSNKVFIRYCLTEDEGYFGLRVQADGTPALFSVKGIEFLDKDFVVDKNEPEEDLDEI